jgi:hypothetical protein
VPVNQPIKAQGELERVKLAAGKLQSPKMKHEWVAVTGMKETWSAHATPKAPAKAELKMAAAADVVVDLESNYYMFLPGASAPMTNHVQLSFPAKKGAKYNFICVNSVLNSEGKSIGALVQLKATRHIGGAAVQGEIGVKSVLRSVNNGVSFFSNEGTYEHERDDATVQLRLTRPNLSAVAYSTYMLFHWCSVQEQVPTTTYKPKTGDRA